ncbi:uncharacterized protein LOC127845773 isoform X2 [Dreissena polymorpha]|uniref:uncharacterized protein LOC127845773 isoform X2 n=1 Tax=Dreissena polymorpha TaxID=45954 RepID=UPI0022656C3F|nr:uncharacterized protein LOC127845773 isoform X2 [Dreissena polymorpha]
MNNKIAVACNKTAPCEDNAMVCDGGYCHIQPGQSCTLQSTSTTVTTPTTITITMSAGRRKRSADQQECVSNASCELNEQNAQMCTCNKGYSKGNGLCTGNGADNLRGAVHSVIMLISVMLYLI